MTRSLKSAHRHFPFMLAFVCGVGVAIILFFTDKGTAAIGGACLFFAVYLAATASRVPRLSTDYLKANAAATDEPAWIIFAITFGTVVVAVGCLFILLNQGEDAAGEKIRPRTIDLVLSLATVALGWLTIHTMAALHYAHLYWRPEDATGRTSDPHRGLEFPGGTKPGVHDFLYFAFVIGMTAQTSDVAITTTAMRKFNLVHGIVSFLFNTVLVAAAVNVAVTLAS